MYPRFCFVVFCCGYTISFGWIHAINSMFVSVISLALGQSCRCQSRWDNGSIYSYTSSNGNIFRVNGHLCGEFTGEFPAQRPVSRSSDVFFDLCLNKRLSKQSLGWWTFSPPSTSKKRSRHSRRMRNPQCYVSGKRPIAWNNPGLLLIGHLGTNLIEIRFQNAKDFNQENEYENVVCIMTVILFWPQWIKLWMQGKIYNIWPRFISKKCVGCIIWYVPIWI